MADYTLTWDNTGEKIYETGDRNMALYVMDAQGAYQDGVAWNGITGVSLSHSGADENALWADDIKYASLRSAEEVGATIEAYQSPVEFDICDGSAPIDADLPGVSVGQQGRRGFGIIFISTVGNDVMGTDFGEKIHILYNCSASPSERGYQTINDSPDGITLSWEITTTPIQMPGTLKKSAEITIDSTKLTAEQKTNLVALKQFIFGDGTKKAKMPTPAQVISLLTTGVAA